MRRSHNLLALKSSDQKIIKLDADGFVLSQKDAEYSCGSCLKKMISFFITLMSNCTSNFLGERFDEERLIKTLTKLCKQSITSQEILNKILKN